jgi:putative membrane protein
VDLLSDSRLKDYLNNSLKGFVMGVAEIIPGISGGTVALVLGIYERLIFAISQFNLDLLRKIKGGFFKEAFSQVDLNFLLSLFVGMIFAIFSLSSLLSFLLSSYEVFFKFFLTGLLLSALFLDEIRPMAANKNIFFGVLCSALIGFILFGSPVMEIESPNFIFIFLSGFIAICALVLPGISGSFILLLIGIYPVIINAVRDLDIFILITFSLGCLAGLLSIVRLVKIIYEKNRNLMRGFFFGLILFSIPLLWKQASFTIVFPSIMDNYFEVLVGVSLGISLILLLEKIRA